MVNIEDIISLMDASNTSALLSIILLLTYFVTSVIRGSIIAYTGFYFINIFHDNFEFIP